MGSSFTARRLFERAGELAHAKERIARLGDDESGERAERIREMQIELASLAAQVADEDPTFAPPPSPG
jgi:hypothetical protein